MKQRRKKVLCLLLAVACSLSIGSQGAAAFQQQADTITDGAELSQLVQDYWEENYFDRVVIDPEEETVTADGERTTLEQTLGLRDTEAEQVMDSAQAAQDYFQDTPYEAEQTEQGTVIVTAPYQTKRLVVSTPTLSTTCGAEETLYDAQTGQHYLQYATQEDAQAAYETLSNRYGTDRCFVDQILDADEVLQTAGEGQTSYSWGASYMGLDVLKEAVADSNMTTTATVAVVDTGVDADHAFFANGRISEHSYSFASDSLSGDDLTDGTGHGTHVAGIVADCTPDNVQLLILRIFNRSGRSSATLMAAAIHYAVQQQTSVINISAGWDNGTANVFVRGILDPAISAAHEAGIPVVTAAGNKRMNVASTYPACHSQTIAVASLDKEGRFDYRNSNYGSGIDFAAPGVSVVSAEVGGGTCAKTGTSMAAPHVAAAAAYVKLFHPDYSVGQLYDELKACALDLGESGKDQWYGWGCVNLAKYSGQLKPKPRTCDDWEITLFPTSCVYDGTAQKPDVTVWVGEEKVPAQYYRVSYEDNDAVGEGTVVVTGLEPYQGTVRRSFAIQFAKPKLSSLANNKNGVTVTWKSVPGAAGYLVERKQGDEGWQRIKTVKGSGITRWMDSSNRSGERYGYRVRAYSGDNTSKASSAQFITYLTAPKLAKLKNTGKRAVTVQWKKSSGASGYQIYYGQTSRFKKAKTVTISKGKSTKAVIKRLQKKKTYYVRIRAYQTVSGKRSYSVWSTPRSVIVKK